MEPIDSALEIVCDAGPLIHLDEVDCLDLLLDFKSILVADRVWQEVEHHRPDALRQSARFRRVSVTRRSDESFEALVRALALHQGEQEALSLMHLYPTAVLLTDDAAARLAAKSFGYRSHGTIAVLLRAIRRQQVARDTVLAILRDLPAKSTLHIQPRLLAEIIEQVEGSG